MTCRYDHTKGRVLPGRHVDDCDELTCRGCQPCTEAHCADCGREHVAGLTCPECVGKAREVLAEIGRMCSALPDEVEIKGVESEAMNLLGPSCDIEARGYVEASYSSGRLPEGWLEASHGKECPLLVNEPCTGCSGGELHPLLVLGTDVMEWQAELDHEDDSRITVASALHYLGQNLTYMAQWPHITITDTWKRWRDCAAHLESVLHDGEHIQRGAPCLRCGATLERTFGSTAEADGWTCPRCQHEANDQQYRLAVKAEYVRQAEWLSLQECIERTGAKRGTIQGWASKGLVKRRLDSGRTVYCVADIEERREPRGVVDEGASVL